MVGGGGVVQSGGGAVHCSCSIAQRGIVCSRGLCSSRSYYYYGRGERRENVAREVGKPRWPTMTIKRFEYTVDFSFF